MLSPKTWVSFVASTVVSIGPDGSSPSPPLSPLGLGSSEITVSSPWDNISLLFTLLSISATSEISLTAISELMASSIVISEATASASLAAEAAPTANNRNMDINEINRICDLLNFINFVSSLNIFQSNT